MNTIKLLKIINLDGSDTDMTPIIVDKYISNRLQDLMLSYVGIGEIYIKLIYNNETLYNDNNVFTLKHNVNIIDSIDYIQIIKCYKKYIYVIDNGNNQYNMNIDYSSDSYWLCLAAYKSFYPNISYEEFINISYIDIIKFNIATEKIGLWRFNDDIKNDYNVISHVVNHNGLLLQYAGEYMRDNYDIVLIAINNNNNALRYASKRLRKILRK